MYAAALSHIGGIILPPSESPGQTISWFVYVIRLADEFTQEHRDTVLEGLRESGIGCSNYFSPIHLQPFYRQMFGFRPGDFPVTEQVSARTIALPFFNSLSETQIEYVAGALNRIVSRIPAASSRRGSPLNVQRRPVVKAGDFGRIREVREEPLRPTGAVLCAPRHRRTQELPPN
jgi:hypothetical protein